MAKLAIQPLEDRVVIQQIEAEEKTAGGIVLPDTAKEKPQRGKVLAVGPGKLLDSGERSRDRREGGGRGPLRQVLRAPRSRSTARRSRSSASPTSWPRSSSEQRARSRRVCPMHSSLSYRGATGASVAKQLLFSDAARRKMLEGVDILAQAVGSTLGPTGRNVILRSPSAARPSPRTASRSPRRSNCPTRSRTWAPSSSTWSPRRPPTSPATAPPPPPSWPAPSTAKGSRYVTSGANPTAVRRGIEKAVEAAVDRAARERSRARSTKKEEIAQVGAISANNDPEIGADAGRRGRARSAATA